MFEEYLEKAERLIRRIRVRHCEVPFVVIFRERSGSSHLCSILGNHTGIACRQEDFHEVVDATQVSCQPDSQTSNVYKRGLANFGETVINPGKRKTIAHLHDIFSCPVKAAGFKFKHHLQTNLFPEITNELKHHVPQLRLITLNRKNALKQSISRQNMQRIKRTVGNEFSNHWDHLESGDVTLPFQLDVSTTITYANQLLREESSFFEWIKPFRDTSPVLDLVYEDLLSDPTGVIRQAFKFLQVDPDATIYSSVAKATSDNLSETISNLDELATAVRGTKLEEFLD